MLVGNRALKTSTHARARITHLGLTKLGQAYQMDVGHWSLHLKSPQQNVWTLLHPMPNKIGPPHPNGFEPFIPSLCLNKKLNPSIIFYIPKSSQRLLTTSSLVFERSLSPKVLEPSSQWLWTLLSAPQSLWTLHPNRLCALHPIKKRPSSYQSMSTLHPKNNSFKVFELWILHVKVLGPFIPKTLRRSSQKPFIRKSLSKVFEPLFRPNPSPSTTTH